MPVDRFHLPGGAIATFDDSAEAPLLDGLFADEAEALRCRVERPDGATIAVTDLPLEDFHTLRALARRLGRCPDGAVPITCRNCGHEHPVEPSATFEIGPYRDDELDDPELDAPFDFHAHHPLAGSESDAEDAPTQDASTSRLKLEPRTVSECAPFHRALARPSPARFTGDVVVAMGIAELDGERDPRRIARRLNGGSDALFDAVAGWFEAAHYPARLSTPHPCPKCRAVEWLGCPAQRELTVAPDDPDAGEHASPTPSRAFPSPAELERRLRRIAPRVYRAMGVRNVSLVVREGAAACDDSGAPLLGSYRPGDPEALPPAPPEVEIFHRTFEAIWEDEGAYDLNAELEETVRHELEHHLGWLAGDDPLDDAEHAAIASEQAGRVGRAETRRRFERAVVGDVFGFLRATWWLWLLVLALTLAAVLGQR